MHSRAPSALETKYRDIADGNYSCKIENRLTFPVGNQVPRYSGWKRMKAPHNTHPLEVGNQVPRYSGWKRDKRPGEPTCQGTLETKYRDIADGNVRQPSGMASTQAVGNQVPRYSGYKSISAREQFLHVRQFAHTMTNKIKNGVRVITRTPFFG